VKRASARTVNVVLPYYGYARQDRKARAREPITAKLVANLLETAGATRAIVLDLHAPQIQGFFDILIDHLMGVPNVAEVMNIVGHVDGKIAILIDDIIDTAGTITIAANALVQAGAKEVYACCTHPVLSGPAIERIDNSVIKELVITNSIELPKEKTSPKIIQLSVGRLLADAIVRVFEEKSVSTLFD
jgi:ribose-phosphate pyrophosphokinase